MKDIVLKILAIIIPTLIEALKMIVSNEQFVKIGDRLLDWCKNVIQKDEDWYDKYLLDLIDIIREAAKIPDLPDTE